MDRLPRHATSEAEVAQYFETRARQLLHEGFRWLGGISWAPGAEGLAYQTFFIAPDDEMLVSYYVLDSATGKGVLRGLVAKQAHRIVTVKDCGIQGALDKVGARYRLAGQLLESVEYKLIEKFYADQRANRSQVFLMNHIDEGLAVMAAEGASEEAMRAFCIHPLLQNDVDLKVNFESVAADVLPTRNGAKVIALAMEYRSVANEYLAHCVMRPDGIRLSPLQDVNLMLVGDKVQNRKDFVTFHSKTHANAARLDEYFRQWCAALGISETRYVELTKLLPV